MAAAITAAAAQAIEMAAGYARERTQFDQPIGSFQAIAHPLAESLTDIEGASLLARKAVWAISRGRLDAAAMIAMACWWASVSARRAAQRALRTFGGYGLSLEYDIQLYFRWIEAQSILAGGSDDDLLRVGDRLWLDCQTALPPAGEVALEFGFGADAERFAEEARDFFSMHMTESLCAKRHHSTDGHDPEFHRALAAAGYAYPDWPRKWGGAARSPFEESALAHVFEEFRWTRVPIGITAMGARMVIMFGSPALQEEVLPRIGDGTSLSCLGFSEPEAGSDVYATRTRAHWDGEMWVINGQKMFTTGAHISDYVLLLTRTDQAATKHRGLTLFLVPLATPGIDIHAVHTLQDERTNITYYGDVHVPDRYRLGEVNDGIRVMAAAMAQEHSGIGYHIYQWSLLDAALRWARTAGPTGARPIDDPAARRRLARAAVHKHIADLLCRQATWVAATGKPQRAQNSMSKLFATDTYMADAADLMDLAAPFILTASEGPLAEIERMFRQSIAQTIYGGTSEIHRGVVAEQALLLPRGRF
jgi:alkylation response protein AidB-like acyl-CoA dehydrogenase